MKGYMRAAVENSTRHGRKRREKAERLEAERIAAEARSGPPVEHVEPPLPEPVAVPVAQAAPQPGRWRRFVRWLLRRRVAE